jgi:hypothetical protein
LKPKEKLDQHINKHKGSKNTCWDRKLREHLRKICSKKIDRLFSYQNYLQVRDTIAAKGVKKINLPGNFRKA